MGLVGFEEAVASKNVEGVPRGTPGTDSVVFRSSKTACRAQSLS